MTQKESQLVLRAFDELNDLLIDLLDEEWEDSVVWDALTSSRMDVLAARKRLATLFNTLLLERRSLP